MTRPHFSLRGLLLLTAALAAFCWYRDRPRQVANRFVGLIEAGDYLTAETMFDEAHPGIANRPRVFTAWRVEKAGQSPSDWLRGRYPLLLCANFGPEESYGIQFAASASGMKRLSESWALEDLRPRGFYFRE